MWPARPVPGPSHRATSTGGRRPSGFSTAKTQQKASSNWGKGQPAFGRGIEQHRGKVARAKQQGKPPPFFRSSPTNQQGQQQAEAEQKTAAAGQHSTRNHWRGVASLVALHQRVDAPVPRGRC